MLRVCSLRHVSRRSPSCCPGRLSPRLSLGPSQCRTYVTDADVLKARAYCLEQIQTGDYDAHLVRHFLPPAVQDAYLALRTLNLELVRLPETVTNPTIGHMRMQFWRDSIRQIFDGEPPREPVSLLLYSSLAGLAARASSGSSSGAASWSSLQFWLQRFVTTRQDHMDNRPFPTLAALEDYAENTYSTLMYITLAMLPLRSMHVDHLASHIGKACGIAAVLRGIPVLAAPSPPQAVEAASGSAQNRNQVLLLPLDIMAEVGLKEEDVYRQGPDAPGLQDAVFAVATRANDHLITAREMLKNIRAGEDPGHDYEHAGEDGHTYTEKTKEGESEELQALHRGFNVLLEAVPTQDFLRRLENANFDPFRVRSSWKLPWLLYRARKTQNI